MRGDKSGGFTLVELVASLVLGALILAALGGIATVTTRSREALDASVELQQQAQFAMERVVRAARATTAVVVPRAEDSGTPHSESVRDVLAVMFDPGLDRDRDGFADADNDQDSRIDEDPSDDITDDDAPGVAGIDDDGDGLVDEGDHQDDDEDGSRNEDQYDGIDNDGDGLVDEDPKRDSNDDGEAGVRDVDDDGDLATDEGQKEDDDEDGVSDEDWVDVVVYRRSGGVLLERLPDLNPGGGNDFTERPIAEGVTEFRVELIPPASTGRPLMLDITLSLTGADGSTASLNARVRAGAVP
jgi:type II secretory pathway pseudopilin PulG